MENPYRIQCLVPDLPAPHEVLPYLHEMHANRWYSNFGPLNHRFELEIKKLLMVDDQTCEQMHTVTFSSATTALELVLRALNLRQGARVLIPTLTFPATASVVLNAGFVPVFADVDKETWALTPDIARTYCDASVIDAVMPVTVFGAPASTQLWDAFYDETGIQVIVDAAASLGQQQVSTKVHFVFSMHATKPFGVGEGGLFVTADGELAAQARALSNFGFRGASGKAKAVGTNAKMAEYFAAMGLAQIDRWPDLMARRTKVRDHYVDAFKAGGLQKMLSSSVEDHVPAVFMIRTKGRGADVMAALDEERIHTRRWYLPPLYEHPAFAAYCDDTMRHAALFPITELLKNDLVGLPFHGFLNDNDVRDIYDIVAATV